MLRVLTQKNSGYVSKSFTSAFVSAEHKMSGQFCVSARFCGHVIYLNRQYVCSSLN